MVRYGIGTDVYHGSNMVTVVGWVGPGIAPNADGTITLPPTAPEIVTPVRYIIQFKRAGRTTSVPPGELTRLAPAPWTVSRRTA